MIRKNASNNYGVKGVSVPSKSFFKRLLNPTDTKLVEQAKGVFVGIEKVKIKAEL